MLFKNMLDESTSMQAPQERRPMFPSKHAAKFHVQNKKANSKNQILGNEMEVQATLWGGLDGSSILGYKSPHQQPLKNCKKQQTKKNW